MGLVASCGYAGVDDPGTEVMHLGSCSHRHSVSPVQVVKHAKVVDRHE